VADLVLLGVGSSLATMLGREGLAGHVFEKARFSREEPCGEGLMLFCGVWVPVRRLVVAHFTAFDFTSKHGRWRTQIYWVGVDQPTPEQDV